MTNPDTLETVYIPNVHLHSFHTSATIVFGAVNLRWSIKAMLELTVFKFNLHKSCKSFFSCNLQSICCRAIWRANKENTSDRMDKSINMNLVGNTESFGSSINSTLSIKILEGSNKMFPFVKSWLVSTSSVTLPSSSTTGFEVFLYLYWDIFSYEYLLLLICLVQHSQLPWSLILLALSICNNHLQIFHSHSHRITTL